MNKLNSSALLLAGALSFPSFAADTYVSGQITSLLAHGTDPAIRITGNVAPTKCNGGAYGWLYFAGTPEQEHYRST